MEDPEVPLEAAQEHIHEHAHGSHEGGSVKKWVLGVALSSAVVAALAAVASLKAGHYANEALLSQIEANNNILKASDQWAEFQANGIKATVINGKIEMLKAVGHDPLPEDLEKASKYDEEKKKTKESAEHFEETAKQIKEEGEKHLSHHVGLALSVTMFQICIAVSAISVLTNRRLFWFVSLIFAAVGIYFLAQGLVA